MRPCQVIRDTLTLIRHRPDVVGLSTPTLTRQVLAAPSADGNGFRGQADSVVAELGPAGGTPLKTVPVLSRG